MIYDLGCRAPPLSELDPAPPVLGSFFEVSHD
jgi:hypothetical protein